MEQLIMDILPAVFIIGGLGLLLGIGLGIASRRFAVDEDETVLLVLSLLPGANCGGCGYAGCDELAKAIIAGEAGNNTCPVGGKVCAANIAVALDQKIAADKKMTAFIKCTGGQSSAVFRYELQGPRDCSQAMLLSGGGPKECKYGCVGMGSCREICPSDAISFTDGIAVINKKLCISCGKCVKICPRKLIELVPYNIDFHVGCNSKNNGRAVQDLCRSGCISCKICEKTCDYNAISIKNNLAIINYDLCKNCGECAFKCPVKVITER